MRLKPQDLDRHLSQDRLSPIYLVSGDEPLQVQEAAEAIRRSAQQQGFAERDLLEADTRFNWQDLLESCNAMSLFAELRLIELRLPSGKPGTEGGKTLVAYADNPPDDRLLLIILPKLEKSQQSTKWFKALDKVGVILQLWPLSSAQLPVWIAHRLKKAQLSATPEAIELLAARAEGNLLAADQEISKLALLHQGQLNVEQVRAAVTDSARYDIFELADSALAGNPARCLRILLGLKEEGTAESLILWALSKEIQTLATLHSALHQGLNAFEAFRQARIWEKRQAIFQAALQRISLKKAHRLLRLCHKTDRAIKGGAPEDSWLLLETLATQFASNTKQPKILLTLAD